MVTDRPRMLVVDDDPLIRSALRVLFERRGWEVATAATVAEGLARLDLDPAPHCVILDLSLPDGGGETILWEVRMNLPRTRVAVCSATADPSRVDLVRRLRPELMLGKPYDVAPLYGLCGMAESPSS